MAFELVQEVLDHAPADLTPSERLILVVIAEMTRKGIRSVDISSADLMRRTGLEERGLRHALRRLATRGLDVRIAIALDKNGKVLYAVKGRVPSYQIPEIKPPDGCTCHRCTKAVSQVLLRKKEDTREPMPDVHGPMPDAQVRNPDFHVPPPSPVSPEGTHRTVDQNRVARAEPDAELRPYDRQLLMDQLAEARRKRRRRSQPP